ncbi:MAG TPA: SUF system NifU family Fe-S cluster assembly protein [Thermoanaerobaculia bacterium]|nr:SUF system NifU family Fe-S cluster assembly protein [Thermoanaerobaculia bacterium]
MSDLTHLYQEIILDHCKRPRNLRQIPDADRRAEGDNPLCGDTITLYLDLAEGRVADVAFQGSGCAISTASASLLTEAVRGRTVEEAREMVAAFRELLTRGGAAESAEERLGKPAVLAGVREYPMRVKCATLAWHTLLAALEEREQPVTTE